MEGMKLQGLVSYGGKVRRRRQCAALAKEEETAAVHRHPNSRSGEEAWETHLLGGRNGGGALRGYRR
ncbi:unnamed protein product [Spirodela intermedia]|uniref:Uncharacterized protein n=1 Tax=Spirodela intermedia TaxID=51605 RepID=A0A7I8II22_SPIIN|nr:unnamed protein product [Spirodela intermedia]CAA6656522.1 unnamed protein product [Spirodela intermedia]